MELCVFGVIPGAGALCEGGVWGAQWLQGHKMAQLLFAKHTGWNSSLSWPVFPGEPKWNMFSFQKDCLAKQILFICFSWFAVQEKTEVSGINCVWGYLCWYNFHCNHLNLSVWAGKKNLTSLYPGQCVHWFIILLFFHVLNERLWHVILNDFMVYEITLTKCLGENVFGSDAFGF